MYGCVGVRVCVWECVCVWSMRVGCKAYSRSPHPQQLHHAANPTPPYPYCQPTLHTHTGFGFATPLGDASRERLESAARFGVKTTSSGPGSSGVAGGTLSLAALSIAEDLYSLSLIFVELLLGQSSRTSAQNSL